MGNTDWNLYICAHNGGAPTTWCFRLHNKGAGVDEDSPHFDAARVKAVRGAAAIQNATQFDVAAAQAAGAWYVGLTQAQKSRLYSATVDDQLTGQP